LLEVKEREEENSKRKTDEEIQFFHAREERVRGWVK